MNAKEFLDKKGWYAGNMMLSISETNGLVSITEAMEQYANEKNMIPERSNKKIVFDLSDEILSEANSRKEAFEYFREYYKDQGCIYDADLDMFVIEVNREITLNIGDQVYLCGIRNVTGITYYIEKNIKIYSLTAL